MNEKYYTYFCPASAWDCPYYNSDNGQCSLEDPIHSCDDAAYYDTDYDWDGEDNQQVAQKATCIFVQNFSARTIKFF